MLVLLVVVERLEEEDGRAGGKCEMAVSISDAGGSSVDDAAAAAILASTDKGPERVLALTSVVVCTSSI